MYVIKSEQVLIAKFIWNLVPFILFLSFFNITVL